MNEQYQSMRTIAKPFGATSHEVGQWLKNLGLRTPDGRPSPRAFAEGWVTQRTIEHSGGYFYVWDAERVSELFRHMGYVGKRGVSCSSE